MKKLLLFGLMLINCYSLCFGQEYCENFKIVSIFDIPPSPQTPGGNYFLLLLTVEEDDPNNHSIFYADLFFVDNLGDTISIPTGPSSTLPFYSIDTIPYILKLNSTNNNQDFPIDFNGKLVILTPNPSNPICEVNYPNLSTSINNVSDNYEVSIYPNPFVDVVKIKSENLIDKILIFDCIGRIVETYYPEFNSCDMNLEKLRLGEYFIAIQFVNGETIVNKILKM